MQPNKPITKDFVPVVTDRGQVEWFSIICTKLPDGSLVPTTENISRYGGDTPVYYNREERTLRLRPEYTAKGWRLYKDICDADAKEGKRWWAHAMERIKPIVAEPNRFQVYDSQKKQSLFSFESNYHPSVVKLRNSVDSTGARILDMTGDAGHGK